jgi:hypothetical protein
VGAFEDVHQDRISGSLAMFDRMIFKGYLTSLYRPDGVRCFLWSQGVALKDFTEHAKATTALIANAARKMVADAGRPVISFDHVKTRNRAQRKDELAQQIGHRDEVTEGIVCLISAVEPCYSFQVRKRQTADGSSCSARNANACTTTCVSSTPSSGSCMFASRDGSLMTATSIDNACPQALRASTPTLTS